jgi:hypothetical protein
MSAGVRVASKRSHADRISFGVILTLALLPACSPERLVLFTVWRGQGLSADVPIAALEVLTSPQYKPGPHQDTRDGAGNTTFPRTVGVYVHARSGQMTVHVLAYAPDGNLIAAGEREVMLNDRREQIADGVFLRLCIDVPDLCPISPPPDGGDAGADAEAGIVVSDAMDVPPTDVPQVGDGPSSDRSDAGDAPEDPRMDRVDAFDAPDADLHVDMPPDHTEVGDAPDGNTEVGPDGGDAADTGVAIPTACKTYCTALLKACSYPFLGQRQCELSCAYAQLAPSDGTLGEPLNCRINSLPSSSDSPAQIDMACNEASLESVDCVPGPCFVYCAQGAAECADPGFSFGDCFNNCLSVPSLGDVESPRSDDSIACRMSWLEVATDDRSMCARGLPLLPVPCQAQ